VHVRKKPREMGESIYYAAIEYSGKPEPEAVRKGEGGSNAAATEKVAIGNTWEVSITEEEWMEWASK